MSKKKSKTKKIEKAKADYEIKDGVLVLNEESLRRYIPEALRFCVGGNKNDNRIFDVAEIASKVQMMESWINEHTEYYCQSDPFGSLFSDLRAYAEENTEMNLTRIASGRVLFEDVPLLFPVDSEIVFGSGNEATGGIVKACTMGSGWSGPCYQIDLRVINNRSTVVQDTVTSIRVPFFQEWDLSEFPIRKITEDEKLALTKRGEIFKAMSTGSVYASYTGTIVQESYWSRLEFRGNGRVMVDVKAFQKVDPEGFRQVEERHHDDQRTEIVLDETNLWRTSPFLYGFSFVAKQWGRITVADLGPVNWRDDAFDKLVLDSETKSVIKSLVKNHGGSFSDIIEGKGGGVIFLLYGPPGEGKTLSAESVAEYLHKPIYPVSVGELGTNPDELEKRLRTILDVASMWDAVLLLDEADIFLEARNEHDIVRNAMVGVFLRLLEYQQGIIFLTSNRAKNIDEAFFSRISIALRFHGSDVEKRTKIWKNLLDVSGVDNVDPAEMAEIVMNGRQIKNAIRIAQTLAVDEGTVMSVEHLKKTIAINETFIEEMKSLRKENSLFDAEKN